MNQLEFNKAIVGRFYLQDLVNKDIVKKLKIRGEKKDEKFTRREV
jgi:hypothetical protein